MNTDTYTVKVEIEELGIEIEHEVELIWERTKEIPESTMEPYEPALPAETSLLSAEVQDKDISFLLGDIEIIEELLENEF